MNRLFFIVAIVAMICSCSVKNVDFDACGQVKATEVTVSAESNGRLLSLSLKEGDKLEKGVLVGAIDSVSSFLKKEELLSRTKATESKRTDIKCQTAAQYARLNSLKMNLKRFENLLNSDAGTKKQVEDTKSEIEVLESQIRAAEQTYHQGNMNIDNEVATLKIQIAQTEDQLGKCRIESPLSGTVLTKYVEAGENVSVGKPLFKVADLDDIYVKAYFTTRQLGTVKLGDKVKVIPDDGSDQPKEYDGVITWIADEAEFTPKNIQTRDERADLVYAVKVAVRNDGRIKLGMYAYIKL